MKQIRLIHGVKKIEGCVRDCPCYRMETCGCQLLKDRDVGNDPNPKFTPPLPDCPLEDYREPAAAPASPITKVIEVLAQQVGQLEKKVKEQEREIKRQKEAYPYIMVTYMKNGEPDRKVAMRYTP